jgi:CCR4-NOT transcriptional regulation complex NOT5 subunit
MPLKAVVMVIPTMVTTALRAGDERQLQAAVELHRRSWFWHRTLYQWMKRVAVTPARTQQGSSAEVGVFEVWDTSSWLARTEQNFTLDMSLVEEAPVCADDTAAVR